MATANRVKTERENKKCFTDALNHAINAVERGAEYFDNADDALEYVGQCLAASFEGGELPEIKMSDTDKTNIVNAMG